MSERIRGFSPGADDYVVKPFSPREVVERVKAILRRTQTPHDAASRLLSCGELFLEPDKYRVYIGEREVSLTASEYTLLYTRGTGETWPLNSREYRSDPGRRVRHNNPQ